MKFPNGTKPKANASAARPIEKVRRRASSTRIVPSSASAAAEVADVRHPAALEPVVDGLWYGRFDLRYAPIRDEAEHV